MLLLKTVLTTTIAILLLFALAKLMGRRQVSQMTLFDYINGITIGSIAAEVAIDGSSDFYLPLVSMTLFALFTVTVSFLDEKSLFLRRVINGEPVLLYANGKLYPKAFRRTRVDINEFLMLCRNAGYFDLSKISVAIIEPNGLISFLPKGGSRPLEPSDLDLAPPDEPVCATLIVDGTILKDNLRGCGRDMNWLNAQLDGMKLTAREVFLGQLDSDGNLSVFRYSDDPPSDIL